MLPPRETRPAETETMRQFRVALKLAMRSLTLEQAAVRGECSVMTLRRILRGQNVTIRTIARVVDRLGARLDIRLAEQKEHM